MSKKTLNTRIQNKRGTTAEWAAGTAPNFIPWDGEIVAYTDVHRIKIGDGTTKVSALPFVDKVRDVTLGGESMVNANGVVELQQTEMTDGYIPVWDNTEKIFKDGYNRNNVVTTDTAQTISGKKTFGGEPPVFDTGFTATAGTTFDADAAFNTELDLNCPIRTNNSLGTLGQVLVSQGETNAPKWLDVPTPSNMVTTNTEQTITAKKNFTGGLAVDGSNAYFANVASNANGSIIDCYENEGNGDSIFSVYAKGADKGEVWFGDGSVDVNIALGSYTYISSDVMLGASSTSYPKNIVQKTGMTLLTSPSANTIASTTYGASGISRSLGNYGYTISLPSGNGTLALTNQIPIKTATLSGTTLSITLS